MSPQIFWRKIMSQDNGNGNNGNNDNNGGENPSRLQRARAAVGDHATRPTPRWLVVVVILVLVGLGVWGMTSLTDGIGKVGEEASSAKTAATAADKKAEKAKGDAKTANDDLTNLNQHLGKQTCYDPQGKKLANVLDAYNAGNLEERKPFRSDTGAAIGELKAKNTALETRVAQLEQDKLTAKQERDRIEREAKARDQAQDGLISSNTQGLSDANSRIDKFEASLAEVKEFTEGLNPTLLTPVCLRVSKVKKAKDGSVRRFQVELPGQSEKPKTRWIKFMGLSAPIEGQDLCALSSYWRAALTRVTVVQAPKAADPPPAKANNAPSGPTGGIGN